MPSIRPLSLQSLPLYFALSSTALLGYVAVDTYRSRRGATPLFEAQRIVKTVEARRYPCVALEGFDAVVRDYYVTHPSSSSAFAITMKTDGNCESKHEEDNLDMWRRWSRVFSDDALKKPRTAKDTESVRLVIPAATTASSQESRELQSADGAVRDQRVASSRWPPGTHKYTALVLEPSTSASSSARRTIHDNPLHALTDSATHQSLVRCKPLSTIMDMDCEGDPTYLGAPYLRVMLSALLLLPNSVPPLKVAVLGVGGGSLPNFLQRYFSRSMRSLDLVDVEPQCLRAAVEDLGMKAGSATVTSALNVGEVAVKLHAMDAARFLRLALPVLSPLRWAAREVEDDSGGNDISSASTTCAAETGGQTRRATPIFADRLHSACDAATAAAAASAGMTEGLDVDGGSGGPCGGGGVSDIPALSKRTPFRPYDLLFIDLFVGSELAGSVTSAEFLTLCRASMSQYGVVAFNLPERNPSFLTSCNTVFGRSNVFAIPVPTSSNTIVLARGGSAGTQGTRLTVDFPAMAHRHFYQRAKQLQEHYKLPYDLANHYPVMWRFW